jgi:hypothetical protein
MSTRKTPSNRSCAKSLHRFDNGFVPTANPAYDSITVTRNSPLISCVQRKRRGEYWIHGGSFIGGGASRPAAAEEAAEYMSYSPHWAVLMRLTNELGWDDVHRYLGMTKYGFISMSLPMPASYLRGQEPPLKRRKISPEDYKRFVETWAAFMKKSHQQ